MSSKGKSQIMKMRFTNPLLHMRINPRHYILLTDFVLCVINFHYIANAIKLLK